MILSRQGAVLHFVMAEAGHDPARSAHGTWIDCSDPDGLAAEWAAVGLARQGIPRLVPPEGKPWGLREMALVDPEGTLLRIGRAIGE
jgi:hypothetical protein